MRTEKEIRDKLALLSENEMNHLKEGIPYPEFPSGYKRALEWVLETGNVR